MIMTLKEIYQALVNDETLINITFGSKIRLAEKGLVDENGEAVFESFGVPEFWKIYKDPNDPKNWIGKLCWFWGIDEEQKKLAILARFDDGSLNRAVDEDSLCKFEAAFGWHKNCRPATREEVEQYLVKEN